MGKEQSKETVPVSPVFVCRHNFFEQIDREKIKSAVGPLIVARQGLMHSVLQFFNIRDQIRFQLLNKRCFKVIVPSLLRVVPVFT